MFIRDFDPILNVSFWKKFNEFFLVCVGIDMPLFED